MAEVGPETLLKYKRHETAYSLIHYLLAGDFFNEYERYSNFLDLLAQPKQFAKYQNLVVNQKPHLTDTCQISWDEIFGEIVTS